MQPELSTSTRERIIAAAIRILGEEGGGSLTVRRVASEAGCSTIGVYTHFTDKTGLTEAVVLDAFERFAAALAPADQVEPGRSRLIASAVAYWRWALANPAAYLVSFTPFLPDFIMRPAIVERTSIAFLAHRARVVHAMADGSLAEHDPDELTRHLWACVHGAVMLALNERTRPDDADAEHRFIRQLDWTLDGLTPRAGATVSR